jgi:hypothetical protein
MDEEIAKKLQQMIMDHRQAHEAHLQTRSEHLEKRRQALLANLRSFEQDRTAAIRAAQQALFDLKKLRREAECLSTRLAALSRTLARAKARCSPQYLKQLVREFGPGVQADADGGIVVLSNPGFFCRDNSASEKGATDIQAQVQMRLTEFLDRDPEINAIRTQIAEAEALHRECESKADAARLNAAKREAPSSQAVALKKELTEVEHELSHVPRSRPLVYLEEVYALLQSGVLPRIRKGFVSTLRAYGYTLYMGDKIILQCGMGREYSLVFSTSRGKPVGIEMNREDIAAEDLATELLNLGMYDCITAEGNVLFGKASEIAREVFAQVRQGIEIFPPDGDEPYRREVHQTGQDMLVLPRHWGQSYLSDLGPDEVIIGQLLGSGHSSKAYRFGELIIVESDRVGEATYFIRATAFGRLRHKGRSLLRSSRPNGFIDRIIHAGESQKKRQEWRRSVDLMIQTHSKLAKSRTLKEQAARRTTPLSHRSRATPMRMPGSTAKRHRR